MWHTKRFWSTKSYCFRFVSRGRLRCVFAISLGRQTVTCFFREISSQTAVCRVRSQSEIILLMGLVFASLNRGQITFCDVGSRIGKCVARDSYFSELHNGVNEMTPTAQPVHPGSVSDFMRDASSYPDRPKSVDVIETHISFVYLTDGYAYKLKKPVRFEFLDFSTPELRHRACLDEVRLNRRLTPNLYVGVLPITRSSSRELELNGDGDPIDWVVQMRRLAANDALDVVIREGRLTSAHSQSVARLLSRFYARMLPKSIGPDVYHEALERHIRGNRKTLLNLLPTEELRSRVRRVQSSQLSLFKNRIRLDWLPCDRRPYFRRSRRPASRTHLSE